MPLTITIDTRFFIHSFFYVRDAHNWFTASLPLAAQAELWSEINARVTVAMDDRPLHDEVGETICSEWIGEREEGDIRNLKKKTPRMSPFIQKFTGIAS